VTPTTTSSAPILRRRERFASVPSTNDVVRGWLAAGEPEICVALADEQTAGRGRNGRTWTAPPGRGVLVSLGFRPTWLSPDRVWRLAASVSLAMADAAEDAADLPPGSIRLKWPNDLVIARDGGSVRKLGGVLGETDGLGTDDPRVVVGIGLNGDWPEAGFPPALRDTMTSLRAAAGDGPIDTGAVEEAFLTRLEARIQALHDDRFDAAGWADRQVTTGREVQIAMSDGTTESVVATGVDGTTGALLVHGRGTVAQERSIVVGEIVHIRLAGL
jgi:BirA family transcriptional regulator, biotin operon repressor / biotin---[acetyl-CoA-carboxylase] ligase